MKSNCGPGIVIFLQPVLSISNVLLTHFRSYTIVFFLYATITKEQCIEFIHETGDCKHHRTADSSSINRCISSTHIGIAVNREIAKISQLIFNNMIINFYSIKVIRDNGQSKAE